MPTTTWIGLSGTNWNDQANWSAGVPQYGDTAVVASGTPSLVAASGSAPYDLLGITILAENFGANATLLSLGGAIIDAGSTLEWPDGSGPVSIAVPTRLDIAAGGALLAGAGQGTLSIGAQSTLDNAGLIGIAHGTLSFNAGTLDNSGAIALSQGGRLDASGDGLVNTGQISIGGGAILNGGLGFANAGTIAVGHGALSLIGGVMGGPTLGSGNGGVIALGDGASVSLLGAVHDQLVAFTGAGGATLTILGVDGRFSGVFDPASLVTGLIVGETIDLAGIAYTGSRTTARFFGGTLTVANGVAAVAIPIATPNLFYSASSFVLTAALDGGTSVTTQMPCFARGTRIATPEGEIAVEALRPGMLVRLAHGGARPVRWVGRRTIDLRRHANPATVAPIVLRRGALAAGIPARDLAVSPDHALLLDGRLVPARFLVNGATVRADPERAEVEYFHVELDAHGVLLAESTPAESYLDTGNRWMFQGGPVLALNPDFRRAETAETCFPLLTEGEALHRIRRKLSLRAHASGWSLSREHGLHLRVGRRRIRPTPGGIGVFAIAHCRRDWRRDWRIASTAAIPAEIDPASTDARRLGVALGRIVLHGPAGSRDVLDHPALSDGFYPLEFHDHGRWRWTDGDARLSAELMAGVERVELEVAAIQPAWAAPAARHAGAWAG